MCIEPVQETRTSSLNWADAEVNMGPNYDEENSLTALFPFDDFFNVVVAHVILLSLLTAYRFEV